MITFFRVRSAAGVEMLQPSVRAGGVSSLASRYFFDVTQPVNAMLNPRINPVLPIRLEKYRQCWVVFMGKG